MNGTIDGRCIAITDELEAMRDIGIELICSKPVQFQTYSQAQAWRLGDEFGFGEVLEIGDRVQQFVNAAWGLAAYPRDPDLTPEAVAGFGWERIWVRTFVRPTMAEDVRIVVVEAGL